MSTKQLHFTLFDNIGNEISFITDASIVSGPDLKIITFVEKTDLELKTKVLIYKDHVEIYRVGLISMFMNFTLDKITKAVIKSSYGHEITMDNKTISLIINDNNIDITYQTSVDMGKGINHTLKMTWEK